MRHIKPTERERWEAAQTLLNAAMAFWETEHNAGHQGAVKWLCATDGSLVIFTRGEYRETLMQNIPQCGDVRGFVAEEVTAAGHVGTELALEYDGEDETDSKP